MDSVKIGIIGGAGHIGLVHAACFAALGYHTVAHDLKSATLKNIAKGKLPFHEPGLSELVNSSLENGRLLFTDQMNHLKDADVVYICVGTPPLPDDRADISQVEHAVEDLARIIQKEVVLVQKSTVPVGTARKIFTHLSQEALAEKIHLVSNPEFLAEGSAVEDFWHPDRIVIGSKHLEEADKVAFLYNPPGVPVVKTSWENAELIKHASNALLATRISYINEIARLCEKVGGDIRSISRGVGLDNRIGPHFLEAGVGFSGPCLEKDLRSLLSQFYQRGEEAPLLKSVLFINQQQRYLLVKKLEKHLGGLEGKRVGVLGLSFKPGTDDLRDSHSLPVIETLLSRGAEVTAHDPMVVHSSRAEWFNILFPSVKLVHSVQLAAEGSDALAILTAWPEYRELDLLKLKESMVNPVIVDGRNLFYPKILRGGGIKYEGVGI